MKLQRLFEMTPAEMAFRGRQHVAKTVDRWVAPSGASSPACRWDPLNGDAVFQRIAHLPEKGDPEAAAALLQQRFEQIAPGRFFAGAGEHEMAAQIATHCPSARQQIKEQADAVCQGAFEILGYGKLSFGSPIDWQFDAVSGQRIAPAHGSRIRYLEKNQVGDSKVVWELNRHQWLLDLGQAWRFSGDERYADCFARLVRNWMKQNPPGFGVNWSSSLEVSMRMISWCWALFLFRGADAFTAGLFQQMLAWIQAHARYVERNLSRYFSPNTHLTGEALGLFYAGTLLPELEGARRWKALGKEILVAELDRQVLPGGVYFEQSTRYQFYTVEMYLHFLILARRNDVAVPASVAIHLEQMMEFLLCLRRPDGTVPQIGDADGGWLLPLVRREPGDYRGLFAVAAVVLRNPQFAWAAGGRVNGAHGNDTGVERGWLLGAQGLNPGLQHSPPPSAPLSCFHEGGYVVMRNGWGERAHHLIFDTGPLGGGSGGHGHADLLSVQCSAWGEDFLVDAGTFCYTADADWRRFFRSSQAHSTVTVDDQGQAEPKGPFSWHSRPSARLLNSVSTPGYCMAEAEHAAWDGLEDPVLHRRRVLFIDSRYWLIIDDLGGGAKHHIDLRYQFAPMTVEAEDDGWVRASAGRSALLVKAFSRVPLAATIARGQLGPPAGWYSPNYGQKVAAPALTFSAEARLPLRLVTLLYPLSEPGMAAPAVEVLTGDGFSGETVSGVIVTAEDSKSIFIEDHEVFVHNGE